MFVSDSSVSRLEGLLAKEEALRRKIEISARESKTEVENERSKSKNLIEEVRNLTIQLETEKMSRDGIREQLSKKGSTKKYFRPKNLSTKNIFDTKIFDQKYFRHKNFRPKIFSTQKFSTQKFSTKNIFDPKLV